MKREAKVLLAVMFALVMFGGAAKQSHAALVFEDGCLVPYAYYSSDTDTTVGLMSWDSGGSVYWTFISPDGVQWSHGVIPLSGAYKKSFSLRTADGNVRPNFVGYIIFTYDTDETLLTTEDRETLTANAVLLTANDAAFLPVVPLDRSDYANVNLDLNALDGASIVELSYGHKADGRTTTNFWIDPAFGAQTQIIVWCSQTPPAVFGASMYSIEGGGGVSVDFNRDHTVLNAYDVATETIGLPAGMVDGLVDILSNQGGERFVFSLVRSSAFSATQTLVGACQP